MLERGGAAHAARTSRPTRWSSASRRGPRYRGREVLTNPPPSSGGILIAYALDLLERARAARATRRALVEVMDATNRARTQEFLEGLGSEGYLERFLAEDALESAAHEVRARLGSTTHISVMDADGGCARSPARTARAPG